MYHLKKKSKEGGRKEERKEKIKPHPADFIQYSEITAKMGKSL